MLMYFVSTGSRPTWAVEQTNSLFSYVNNKQKAIRNGCLFSWPGGRGYINLFLRPGGYTATILNWAKIWAGVTKSPPQRPKYFFLIFRNFLFLGLEPFWDSGSIVPVRSKYRVNGLRGLYVQSAIWFYLSQYQQFSTAKEPHKIVKYFSKFFCSDLFYAQNPFRV